MSIVWSVIGIIICGGLGGIAAWAAVTSLGLEGIPGAIAAAVLGMVAAVSLWVGLTAVMRKLRWIR
jgi:hypothetical protein